MRLPEPLPTTPKMHLYQLLPSRWEDVISYVESESGDLLKKAVGEEFLNVNIKMRSYDIEHYFKMTLSDEVRELTIRY